MSLCLGFSNALPMSWNISVGSCVSVLKSGKNIAMDGRAFLFLKGEISQTLKFLKVDKLYRITFVTAHPPLLGAVLANKEGYVEFDGQRHVFMVYTKHDKHDVLSTKVDWHHHTFYFRSYRQECIVKLGSMTGNTGILFDDLKVQETELYDRSSNNANGKHVHAHVISLHQWSSIHASWSFIDPESPIVDYMWAIGYTEGSTEVQGFKSVGLSNFAYNYNVTLAHTSIIHITVVATNAAGLRREAHAEDLLVDLTPPDIVFINDGIGSDIAAQTIDEISANWDVIDSESGLDYCEWAVGYQPYGNEIQTFKKLPSATKTISKVFPSNKVYMQMIHVTLRCRNNAGLQSSLSTDGVKISNLPPNTTYSEVEVLSQSQTEYNARDHYQGDTSLVRLKWTGFEDLTGIGSHVLTFENQDKTFAITKSMTAEDQDTSYCILLGLDLKNGNYTAGVKAVNKMFLRSLLVTTDMVVTPSHPQLIDDPSLQLQINNRTLSASWKDHFQTTTPIFYEVSAGTTLGSADIIQWQETKYNYLDFTLPPKIESAKHVTIYAVVRGVSANGMTKVLNAAVKIS